LSHAAGLLERVRVRSRLTQEELARAGAGKMRSVPTLTPRAIPAGSLAQTTQPELVTDGGLLLRPWKSADAPVIMRIYADPDIQRWHGFAISNQGEAAEMIERWGRWWWAETGAHWAIVPAAGGEPVGRVGLRVIDTRQGVAEAIYSTAAAMRGHGIAPTALDTLATWAFSVGFHRLFLRHSTLNPASCRVAAKSGFDAEGTERGSELHTDGWHDMHVHARLAPGSCQAPC
jgi:[ribosomal protein S5]-alanine N-acetyltransferase